MPAGKKYIGQLRGGAGVAVSLFEGALAYLLADGSFEASPRYEEDDYAIGGGVTSGVFTDINNSLRLSVSVEALRFGLGDEHSEMGLKGEGRYRLGRNISLRLSVYRETEFDQYWNGAVLSLQRFF